MSAEPEIYVGLMSGTSMDSMDCCAVQIDDKGRMQVLRCLSKAWPPHIRAGLHALCRPGGNEIDHAGVSSNAVGAFSALTVRELLKDAGIEPSQVRAVGSHGQTVRHRPERGFTGTKYHLYLTINRGEGRGTLQNCKVSAAFQLV